MLFRTMASAAIWIPWPVWSPDGRSIVFASHVLGHKKVFEDTWAGLLHLTFLYGFLILAIGHIAHHKREWETLYKLIGRNGPRGRNPEIEVDVRIDCKHQVLQHNRPEFFGCDEC